MSCYLGGVVRKELLPGGHGPEGFATWEAWSGMRSYLGGVVRKELLLEGRNQEGVAT